MVLIIKALLLLSLSNWDLFLVSVYGILCFSTYIKYIRKLFETVHLHEDRNNLMDRCFYNYVHAIFIDLYRFYVGKIIAKVLFVNPLQTKGTTWQRFECFFTLFQFLLFLNNKKKLNLYFRSLKILTNNSLRIRFEIRTLPY